MTKLAQIAAFYAALAFGTVPFAIVASSAADAQEGSPAPYTLVESGQGFTRLQDAVNAIGNGRGTIRFGSARFADCAVQEGGEVTYVAAVPGQAILEGVVCEGKAALVLRGRSAKVDGLVFAGIRVPDRNGAGIRLEQGNLFVTQSWFRDSEEGILTAPDPSGAIVIDKSTFSRLGRCDGDASCAHSIYTADYGSLTVTRSRFEAGRGGHYLKTHARRVEIAGNSFDDSRGSTTNYMIDLSVGSTGRIAGNWMVQGRDKENYSAFIAIAAEGHKNRADGLVIDANDARFAPGVDRSSQFIADWSGDKLAIGQNTLGAGIERYKRR
ncbi:MAG: right-handed parallel beta-helix repeat-containing protein [Novosphingobium sp.]